MFNLVDIISALDFEFTENSVVRASNGEIVRIDGRLWKKSPVLREHASSGISHKVLAASKSALEAVNKAHQDGIFPTGIRELYELLAAASELCLGELTSECLENLRSLNAFDESVDLPPELSVDIVMRVFNVLLEGPPRTFDIYKRQLSRIARYCANNRDVMTNAMNSLKQSLAKFKDIDLEGIPASFEARTLPVAVYKRRGELQTVVILGADVIPVNLFGNHINLEDIDGDGFYLKYGVYLLYLGGSTVHYKYLLDDSEPREVLSDCCLLLTRGNFVFAARNENDFGSILLWTDDVKFEKIYQSAGTIKRVDFDHKTRSLAVVSGCEGIRVFRLQNETLFLLEEMALLHAFDILLSGRYMFIYHGTSGDNWVTTRRVVAIDDGGSSRSIDEQPGGEDPPSRIYASALDFQTYHIGGSYFLRDTSGLKLVPNFPKPDGTRLLMTCGELVALSELRMSP